MAKSIDLSTYYYNKTDVDTLLNSKADTTDLSTVAFSGSYNNLTNKPNIPKVYYGTCSSSANSQIKYVTTNENFSSSSDITTGMILFIKFTYAQTYESSASSKLQLGIDNISSTGFNVSSNNSSSTSSMWKAGEVVGFVYTGSEFVVIDSGVASTTYYGITKLTNSVSSTSTTTSATPNSVKTAYDLANTKLGTTDIADNLTTNDATQVLSAKQGKVLNDLIGDAITYINQ